MDAAIKKLPENDTLKYGVLAEGAPPGNDDPPNAGCKVRQNTVGWPCDDLRVCHSQLLGTALASAYLMFKPS